MAKLTTPLSWPALYKKSKRGKITKWQVWTELDENGVAVIVRESGYIDGKRKEKRRYVRKGTNVGRSNEKTPLQHANFIARRCYKVKVQDNFVIRETDVNLPPKFIYPMLADKYNVLYKKGKHEKLFPMYAQPKFNGIRGWLEPVRTPSDGLISRELNEFTTIDHINKAVKEVFGEISPDGEIYKMEGFQTLVKWVKKYRKGFSEQLEYWVFDLAIHGKTFEERLAMMDELIPDNHPIIKKAPTVLVRNHEEFKALHDKWALEDGFEGIMGRQINSLYGFNDRNQDLLKWKYFVDEEFMIVDAEAEEWDDTTTGQLRKIVVWVCEAENGKRFNARPKGSMMKREQMWKDRDNYMGKMLTVRYQELSEHGVPTFPVGLVVRDYE